MVPPDIVAALRWRLRYQCGMCSLLGERFQVFCAYVVLPTVVCTERRSGVVIVVEHDHNGTMMVVVKGNDGDDCRDSSDDVFRPPTFLVLDRR